MPKTREVTRVHHKTVSEYKKHQKRRTPSRKSTTTTTESTKVDPRVWATAIKLANGDISRITIESDASVIVRNP